MLISNSKEQIYMPLLFISHPKMMAVIVIFSVKGKPVYQSTVHKTSIERKLIIECRFGVPNDKKCKKSLFGYCIV